MIRPIAVKPTANFKIWVKYSDGVEGEVDLSEFAGKGIFKLWDNYTNFEKVYIGEGGEIAWGKEIDLCPDTIYMKLTQKTPEELFPNLRKEEVNA